MHLFLHTEQERAVVAKALSTFIDRWDGIESAADIEIANGMLAEVSTRNQVAPVVRPRSNFISPVSNASSQAYSTFAEGDIVR